MHTLFGVNTTAVYHNTVAQAQIRTLPWDPMVSKRMVLEARRATFSNSIYHGVPGPKEVFSGPSADTQIKEKDSGGKKKREGDRTQNPAPAPAAVPGAWIENRSSNPAFGPIL